MLKYFCLGGITHKMLLKYKFAELSFSNVPREKMHPTRNKCDPKFQVFV